MDLETFGMLRDTVRRFVDERLAPNEDRLEAEDAAPPENIQEMRKTGLFGRLRIYEGASQIQQVVIARSLLREAGLNI